MRAVTIGGAMIDTIAIIGNDRIERMTMLNAGASFLLLAEGQKTEAEQVSAHCGGGALNTAAALARLGHSVSTIIKLGRDPRARLILACLSEEKISPRWIVQDSRATTGASVIVSSHDRNAAIFTYRGANALLEVADLNPEAFAVDLVHIASLSNRSADCFPFAVETAAKAGAFVSANPGIRQLSSQGPALPASLAHVSLLCLNKAEASVLVPGLRKAAGKGGEPLTATPIDGVSALSHEGLSHGGDHLSLPSFCRGLREIGVRRVLITDGAHGAFLADGERIVYCPVPPATVASTAGAGDAMAATVASTLAGGGDLETALKLGAINAASVVSFASTQTGLLDAARIRSALSSIGSDLHLRSWPI